MMSSFPLTTLWLFNIAMENIDYFPIKTSIYGWDFPVRYVSTRGPRPRLGRSPLATVFSTSADQHRLMVPNMVP